MSQVIVDLVDWLKQWFYTESEVDEKLGEKVSVAQGSGNASKNVVTDTGGNIILEAKPTIDTALSSSSTNAVQNKAINTALSNKADSSTVSTLSGTVSSLATTVDGKLDASDYVVDTTLSSSSTNPLQNKAINTALSNKSDTGHTHSASDVSDGNAHSHIDTSANASQATINTAIDTAIGNLSSINAINIVDTLPTATASTMGALYIVSENSKVNVYYTEENDGVYSWHKMDTDILDELSIAWSDVTGKPFDSVDSAMSSSSTNPVQNSVLNTALSGKAPTSHASSSTTYGVGTTSNYGHVKTINGLTQSSHSNGTALSAYQGYVLKGLIDGLDTDKEEVSNKVTSLSSSSTDTQYPSAKSVYDALQSKNGEYALKVTVTGTSFSTYSDTPFTSTGTVTIDYGDGTIEEYSSGAISHTYASSGTYTVKIYGNITVLNANCFREKTNITSVVIGDTITSLRGGCFENCTGLTSITIPSSVTTMRNMCFKGCTGLTSIDLKNVTSLGIDCFKDCTGLTTVDLKNVTSLGDTCFYRCNGLTSIDLANVTSLGDTCFYGCTGLTSLNIPSTVTSIGKTCFSGATNLTTLKLNWTDSSDIITYANSSSSDWVYRSSVSSFIIPKGTKSLYTAKSYPSAQLHIIAYEDEALGTTITLVDAGETNEGCIIFNTIN